MEMQNTMARLVTAQDEIRVQIEVLQRTVRNHFVSADGSSQRYRNPRPRLAALRSRVMFADSISDQGP
uniref:Transposase n=1 Tax=Steinernema glaseri TaxID=37863 RepID=A0A1I7Z2T6_9BILA